MSKMPIPGFVLLLFALLVGACGPAETPVVPQPTAVPQPPTTPPGPTPSLTAGSTPPPDPRAEIEADLWNYTRVRAEAEKTLDPELLRQVCLDPYLARKTDLIDKNKQDGVHWETRSVSLTITALDVEAAGRARVAVRKTETKLFFPRGSSMPDDEVCGDTISSYRGCTYDVLYTMTWWEGRWYVSDLVDHGDCRGVCQRFPEPTVGPYLAVSFAGITFSYDAGLASGVIPEIVPGDAESPDQWRFPQHDRFSFQGYALPGTNDEPRLLVYPVAEYEALSEPARSSIADLRRLLAERPAAPAHIPFLPYQGAEQFIRAQVAYLDFQNGTGVRFLTMYGQDYVLVGSSTLFYTFQGLTGDGQYYVSAILPVAPPPLAVCADLPCDDFPALVEKWDLYIQDATQQLDAADAAGFTPDLTRLDALIRSLRVK